MVTLASAAAGFECRAIQHVELGDHVLVPAHVTSAWRRDAIPLLHLNGDLVPARSPMPSMPDPLANGLPATTRTRQVVA